MNEHYNFKKIRLRTFFLNLERKKKKSLEKDLEKNGMEYIQMKLPVKNINKEFEKSIINKLEQNMIKSNIRTSTEKDLQIIIGIYNKAWLTSNEPFMPLSYEAIDVLFNDPHIIILIAKVYGIDAGFIILDLQGPNNEYGLIAGLAVLPRFQRKGLGTNLGIAAWNFFKEKEIKELRCEVYPGNIVSYNFIKSLGFKEYDRKYYKAEDFILEEKSN